MPSEERLAKLTAKTLTAPDVSILQTNEDPAKTPDRLTFRDVVLTDVMAGKIGTLAASGMSLSSTASDKPPTAVESGPIAATQVDLPLGLMIATGTRSDKDMPLANDLRQHLDRRVQDQRCEFAHDGRENFEHRGEGPAAVASLRRDRSHRRPPDTRQDAG